MITPALIHRFAQIYRSTMAAIVSGMMVLLLVIMCLQVFFRYVLNDSMIWAEEVCRYLLVWASFLACGLAFDRGEIAALNLFRDVLPARVGALVAIAADVLILVLMAVLVLYGWRYAEFNSGQPIPAFQFISADIFGRRLAVSIFWVYLAVPVGMTLLACHVAVHLIKTARVLANARTSIP